MLALVGEGGEVGTLKRQHTIVLSRAERISGLLDGNLVTVMAEKQSLTKQKCQHSIKAPPMIEPFFITAYTVHFL